jgi:DNA-binding CsgD family transcriptional regulator
MKRNLFDEEKTPTLEEIKENFIDFTAEALPLSNDELNEDSIPLYKRAKYILSSFLWKDLDRMKRTAPESCFTKDDPIEVFLNFIREYIARAIVKLDEEGIAVQIIDEFNKNRDPNISDDEYASRAVKMLMEVTNMQDVIDITKEIPDALDFSNAKDINYPKMDFNRKWKAKLDVVSSDYDDKYIEQVESYNADLIQHPDEEAIDNVGIVEFMSQITAQDKQMLMMRLEGKAYEDIATELGYHDHTAVIKRMRRLGETFEKQVGMNCGFTDKKVKSSYNKTK